MAAEWLNVSARSISTAIAQLEAEFGSPLFVRKQAHGMSSTQSGREMIREAATALTAAVRLSVWPSGRLAVWPSGRAISRHRQGPPQHGLPADL